MIFFITDKKSIERTKLGCHMLWAKSIEFFTKILITKTKEKKKECGDKKSRGNDFFTLDVSRIYEEGEKAANLKMSSCLLKRQGRLSCMSSSLNCQVIFKKYFNTSLSFKRRCAANQQYFPNKFENYNIFRICLKIKNINFKKKIFNLAFQK